MKFIRKIYDWMASKVHSKYAIWWLACLFFVEAFFFFPVDPLLILFCIQNNKRSFFYASISTISSILGGLAGYAIGALMWQSIGIKLVSWLISETTFNNAVLKYKIYQHWAVLIAGFTPLPYKAITLSAGFCNLPIMPFVIFSFISRGARFFLVSGAIYIWGEQIKDFIDRHFNQLVVLFTVILILSFWLLK
ncbi:DedA family protein [Candidatus Dependentiae bacterium]|nr:DedA family protein [Candidatus Dependentiae bacterium]